MDGEIITVGNELIYGQVMNRNGGYLSQKLTELGINIRFHQSVGDDEERLENALKTALNRVDLVVITGGLGPTEDDITKEVTARTLGLEMIFSNREYIRIQSFFKRLNRTMSDNNKKQAYIPQGAEVMENQIGTASGIFLKKGTNLVALLPGPPRELKHIFETHLSNKLKEICVLDGDLSYYFSGTLKIIGLGESKVDEKLIQLKPHLPSSIEVAPLAKRSQVHLLVKGKDRDKEKLNGKMDQAKRILKEAFSDYYWGEDDETLEKIVINKLSHKGATVALAESVTGGLISNRLTNVPGASQVFNGGIVCYSDYSKQALLHVTPEMIATYTSVSAEVSEALAKNAKESFCSTIGVGVTGYAGPGGEKPGQVIIAVTDHVNAKIKTLNLPGTREDIKEGAANYALNELRLFLLGAHS